MASTRHLRCFRGVRISYPPLGFSGSMFNWSTESFYYLYMELQIIDNVCPHCNEHIWVNKRVFANHVRWCRSNPRYQEILQGTRDKLHQTSTKQTHEVSCEVCGQKYEVVCTPHEYEIGKYKKTCCDGCAKKLTVSRTNLDEKANKIANSLKGRNVGRGKDITYYKKICPCCGIEFETRKFHKIYCSSECHNKYRKIINNTVVKKAYHSSCSFKFGIASYPEEFNTTLIKEYGWYSASNHGGNLTGVSRDHMFSCNEGWRQKIDPYIISHPANCELMRHNENFKKLDSCSISLEDLKQRIIDWNHKYGIYPNMIDYEFFEDNGIIFERFLNFEEN